MIRRCICLVTLSLLLLLTSSCCATYPNCTSTYGRLWNKADAVILGENAILLGDARAELQRFVEKGAARLEAEHADEQRIRAAEDSIAQFAKELVAQATTIPPNERATITLDPRQIVDAQQKVCPLYPFC